MAVLDARRFKFIDEAGSNLALTRLFGRAPRGARVTERVPVPDGSVIAVTMSHPIASRYNRGWVAAGLADTGFCATKQQHYRGVKLHVIAARRSRQLPLPEKLHLSRAAQPDLAALREMSPSLPAGCSLFADKAYFHRDPEKACKARGWFLVASSKRHRHESETDVPTLYNRFVSVVG